MRLIRTSVLAIALACTAMSAATAADYYVKPSKGGSVTAPALTTMSVPGVTQTGTTNTTSTGTTLGRTTAGLSGAAVTPANTFASMSALFTSNKLKSGDRIFLMNGAHGPLVFRGMKFAAPVLIAPMPGSFAQVDSILIDSSANLVFQDLGVWPTSLTPGKAPLIRSYGNTSDLIFTNLDVRSVFDAPNYSAWSRATWISNKRAGFLIDGNRVTVRGTRITGLQNGIIGMADNLLLDHNTIDGFSADALRALGDNSIVRGNLVQNCMSIDLTHHDGFQSYSVGPTGKPGTGTQRNLVIENNRIFETVGKPSAMKCLLQGIGMFDGMYDGVVIQNNLIAVSAYHGIAIAGALNAKILQNTIVPASGLVGKFPWIKVSNHKLGMPSSNVVIENNLSTNVVTISNPTRNIVVSNNPKPGTASNEFTAFAQMDLSLKATSKGVDAGDTKATTLTDVMGVKRWKGNGPDAGAYESR